MLIQKVKVMFYILNLINQIGFILLLLGGGLLPVEQVWAANQVVGQLSKAVTFVKAQDSHHSLSSSSNSLTAGAKVASSLARDKSSLAAHSRKDQIYHNAYASVHRQHLSAMESNGIVSNAYAFGGLFSSEVNPRDGQLSVSVKVADLFTDNLRGANIELSLSYSSGSKSNLFGLGVGWSWNLGMISATGDTDTTTGKPLYSLSTSGGGYTDVSQRRG